MTRGRPAARTPLPPCSRGGSACPGRGLPALARDRAGPEPPVLCGVARVVRVGAGELQGGGLALLRGEGVHAVRERARTADYAGHTLVPGRHSELRSALLRHARRCRYDCRDRVLADAAARAADLP